jgi:hypothetical protein
MGSGIQASTLVPDTIADIVASFAHIFEKGHALNYSKFNLFVFQLGVFLSPFFLPNR